MLLCLSFIAWEWHDNAGFPENNGGHQANCPNKQQSLMGDGGVMGKLVMGIMADWSASP